MSDPDDVQSTGRRALLKAAVGLPALGVVAMSDAPARARVGHASNHHASEPAAQNARGSPAASTPQVLDPQEFRLLEVLSDLIIPADEHSPGAAEVGVPAFIDGWIAFKGGELLSTIRGGLIWLNVQSNHAFGTPFVDISPAQQREILDRIAWSERVVLEDRAGAAFFYELRKLVVGGFFSTEAGVADLQYLGNSALPEWTGCPREALAKLGVAPTQGSPGA